MSLWNRWRKKKKTKQKSSKPAKISENLPPKLPLPPPPPLRRDCLQLQSDLSFGLSGPFRCESVLNCHFVENVHLCPHPYMTLDSSSVCFLCRRPWVLPDSHSFLWTPHRHYRIDNGAFQKSWDLSSVTLQTFLVQHSSSVPLFLSGPPPCFGTRYNCTEHLFGQIPILRNDWIRDSFLAYAAFVLKIDSHFSWLFTSQWFCRCPWPFVDYLLPCSCPLYQKPLYSPLTVPTTLAIIISVERSASLIDPRLFT